MNDWEIHWSTKNPKLRSPNCFSRKETKSIITTKNPKLRTPNLFLKLRNEEFY